MAIICRHQLLATETTGHAATARTSTAAIRRLAKFAACHAKAKLSVGAKPPNEDLWKRNI
jgi:hypothetical protein